MQSGFIDSSLSGGFNRTLVELKCDELMFAAIDSEF